MTTRYEYKCEDCNKIAAVREGSLFYCASCWFKNFMDGGDSNEE